MKAPCQYFGSCGGCSLQDKTYEEQIRTKSEKLKFMFNKDIILHSAPEPFGYRTRADFQIRDGKIGFRPQNNPKQVIDIKECLLISKKANLLLEKVRSTLAELSFSSYELRTHKGFLRYLSIRETSTELMLIFTTSDQEEAGFLDFLKSLSDQAESIIWLVNASKTDDVMGTTKQVIGKEQITENINKISYEISPNTFFQSNRLVAQEMFNKIVENVAENDSVLDLYCGIGSISLQVAQKAKSVLGVETVQDSILAAKNNAELNNITNTSFEADDTKEFLARSVLDGSSFDTIIVDPPRMGLGLELCRTILSLKPKKIIYMSCNPATLRNDMAILATSYTISSLEAYDMFPQTDHVECLAVLKLSD